MQEQSARAELARVHGEICRTRDAIAQRQQELRELLTRMGGRDVAGRISDQQVFVYCCRGADRRLEQLRRKLHELEQARSDATEAFLSARRTREGLEALREQARVDYEREMNSQEQKFLDETATVRFARVRPDGADRSGSQRE